MTSRGELTAIRWEIERSGRNGLAAPSPPHNAWTGRDAHRVPAVMADLEHRDDVRAVIVTGTPPAFCVGGDSKALGGHADRGGYDSGLAGGAGAAGRRRPTRRRFRVAARLSPADHRRGERCLCRSRPGTGGVLRPAVRRRRRQDHDGRAEARTAGGVRAELDPAPPVGVDPSQRPAPVGPGGDRVPRPPTGVCGTVSARR